MFYFVDGDSLFSGMFDDHFPGIIFPRGKESKNKVNIFFFSRSFHKNSFFVGGRLKWIRNTVSQFVTLNVDNIQ